MRNPVLRPGRQGGATIVEFALVLLIFLTFFLGIWDFGRMLFTWNATSEATRLGARYAAVCDDRSRKALVLAKMQQVVPEIADIAIEWSPAGCSASTCQAVRVEVTDLKFQWISPVAGAAALAPIELLRFSTYLPREAMRQDANSDTLCASTF